MNIIIEKAQECHLSEIEAVEKASFSLPWSLKAFSDELKNDAAVYFVAVYSGEVVGYVGMWEISGSADIMNIAVLPKYRRCRVASALLSHLIDYCKSRRVSSVFLEVRVGNAAAIRLYEKHGFKAVGRRKHYYADNREDALIMECLFS